MVTVCLSVYCNDRYGGDMQDILNKSEHTSIKYSKTMSFQRNLQGRIILPCTNTYHAAEKKKDS